jgi:hypothetical protein
MCVPIFKPDSASGFFLPFFVSNHLNFFLVGKAVAERDRRLSSAPSGTAHRDLQNGINYWMKSITLERRFLLTFCRCRQKISRAEGISCEKIQADAARGGDKRSACF